MFHLVEDTFGRIEGNLIQAGKARDGFFSMIFNIVSLVTVLGGFLYFLFYNKADGEKQSIEVNPQPWLNAVRNVPGDQDYRQVPQTEIRGGIQGFVNRSSATEF